MRFFYINLSHEPVNRKITNKWPYQKEGSCQGIAIRVVSLNPAAGYVAGLPPIDIYPLAETIYKDLPEIFLMKKST